MLTGPWKLLDIAPTRDELAIRRAYARRLRDFRPDEDPKGFQALVEARERALKWPWPRKTEDAKPSEPGTCDAHAGDGTAEDSGTPIQSPEKDEKSTPVANSEPEAEAKPSEGERGTLRPLADTGDLLVVRIDEPDPIVVRQKAALDTAMARFRALTIQGENASNIFSDVAGWRTLLDELHLLTILQRRALRDLIVRKTMPGLPEPVSISDLQSNSSRERAPIGFVSLIEDEFKLSLDQPALVRLCGNAPTSRYLHWLDRSNDLRTLEQRLSLGRAAYRDANGIAIIPPGDRNAPLFMGTRFSGSMSDANMKAWLASAQSNGRWPGAFVWHAFLCPRVALLQCGFPFLAFVDVGLESFSFGQAQLALGVGAPPSVETNYIYAWLWLAVIVAMRALVALSARRLAVVSAVRRIRRADREHIFGAARRKRISAGGPGLNFALRFVYLFELGLFFGFVGAFIHAIGLSFEPHNGNGADPDGVLKLLDRVPKASS